MLGVGELVQYLRAAEFPPALRLGGPGSRTVG